MDGGDSSSRAERVRLLKLRQAGYAVRKTAAKAALVPTKSAGDASFIRTAIQTLRQHSPGFRRMLKSQIVAAVPIVERGFRGESWRVHFYSPFF